jgi:hypothetical protein
MTDSSGAKVTSVPAGVVNFHVKNNVSARPDRRPEDADVEPGSSRPSRSRCRGASRTTTPARSASTRASACSARWPSRVDPDHDPGDHDQRNDDHDDCDSDAMTTAEAGRHGSGHREGVQDHAAERQEARRVFRASRASA